MTLESFSDEISSKLIEYEILFIKIKCSKSEYVFLIGKCPENIKKNTYAIGTQENCVVDQLPLYEEITETEAKDILFELVKKETNNQEITDIKIGGI